jgi:hypothetical protein
VCWAGELGAALRSCGTACRPAQTRCTSKRTCHIIAVEAQRVHRRLDGFNGRAQVQVHQLAGQLLEALEDRPSLRRVHGGRARRQAAPALLGLRAGRGARAAEAEAVQDRGAGGARGLGPGEGDWLGGALWERAATDLLEGGGAAVEARCGVGAEPTMGAPVKGRQLARFESVAAVRRRVRACGDRKLCSAADWARGGRARGWGGVQEDGAASWVQAAAAGTWQRRGRSSN